MIHIEPGCSTKESRLPFEIEEWVEMAIGMFVILLRLYARTRAVGFRKWQGDDYLGIVVLVLWVVKADMRVLSRRKSSCSSLCVSSSSPENGLWLTGYNPIVRFGANARLSDEQRASMEEWEIREREFGAKCLLVSWVVYVTLIWVLKACMLFFYNRLTIGLVQQRFVKVAAAKCGRSTRIQADGRRGALDPSAVTDPSATPLAPVIAIITVNIPCIWPLLRRSSSSREVSTGASGTGRYKLGPLAGTGTANRRPAGPESILEDSQSQFVSDVRGGTDRVGDETGRGIDGIQVTTVYEVKHDPAGADFSLLFSFLRLRISVRILPLIFCPSLIFQLQLSGYILQEVDVFIVICAATDVMERTAPIWEKLGPDNQTRKSCRSPQDGHMEKVCHVCLCFCFSSSPELNPSIRSSLTLTDTSTPSQLSCAEAVFSAASRSRLLAFLISSHTFPHLS
ncbi:uncharacterized protein BO96DRAFT_329721 [Aspergillus niger CBS 101883]|uniref:Contig An13c0110, genomic contig n=3 Tax=Aspergillus niger TaxID=5061 RepID=A2R262_ASPNC|nr:uncharacterized protein BO96DRAFT_329721 [Aspergillus niger CBS 101883]XP_059602188.1 uncharacterized protein An13g03660 [Aspergillus niger]PYH59931.1 hypothetical protein BO96DRAFT_329721 [Aspergillus niger CBS 101883]RDH24420.1 hypothetical protein M747DRAFT_229621 [Aspergillus niger ATCC 13496]CAK41762.1 unnamed protein product [Aspergillus niger]